MIRIIGYILEQIKKRNHIYPEKDELGMQEQAIILRAEEFAEWRFSKMMKTMRYF